MAGSRFLSPFGGQAPGAREAYVIMLTPRGELLIARLYCYHSVFMSQDSLHAAPRAQRLARLSPMMDPSPSEALSEFHAGTHVENLCLSHGGSQFPRC